MKQNFVLTIRFCRYKGNYDNFYYKRFKDAKFSIDEVNKVQCGIQGRKLQSISEIGQEINHVCNSENKENTSGKPLEPDVLLFPILFASVCAIAAITFWIMKFVKDEKRVNSFKPGARSIRKSQYQTENCVNYSLSYIEDEVLFYERKCDQLSVYEIVEELSKASVSENAIETALEELPNREELRKLYVENSVSDVGKMYRLLSELSILQLCSILKFVEGNDRILEDESEWQSLLEEDDPKRELIGEIIAVPEYRNRAIEVIFPTSGNKQECEVEVKVLSGKSDVNKEMKDQKDTDLEEIKSCNKGSSCELIMNGNVAIPYFSSGLKQEDDDSLGSVANSRAHTL